MCQWLMLTTAASSRSLRYPDPGFPTRSPAQSPTVQSWPFPNSIARCPLALGLKFPESPGVLSGLLGHCWELELLSIPLAWGSGDPHPLL